MVHRQVKKVAKNSLVNWGASILYVFGLSLLIPIVVYVLYPQRVFTLTFVMTVVLALLCIVAAYRLLRWYYPKKHHALLRLSYATLFPALLAVVFSFYPLDLIFVTLDTFLPNIDRTRPLVDAYVQSSVPHVGWVLLVYALVGGWLLWRGLRQR